MEKRQISMWLPADLLDKIETRAVETNQTRNAWMEKAVTYVLAEKGGYTFTETTTRQVTL